MDENLKAFLVALLKRSAADLSIPQSEVDACRGEEAWIVNTTDSWVITRKNPLAQTP